MFRCPYCGRRERSAPTHVTVRATILAMGRFGVVSEEVVKELEKRWRKHRKEHDLDAYGRKSQDAIGGRSCEPRPASGCSGGSSGSAPV